MNRPASSALPATAASQPRVAHREEVVDRRDAPGRDHREAGAEHLGEELDIRPRQRAVAGGARDEEPRDAGARAVARERRSRRPRRPRPAVDRDLAVADVDRDDEPLAEPGRGLREERGGERGGADHDAVGTGGERRRDRVVRAVAAAHLKRQASRGGDSLDEVERRHAAEGAVEVDEVESARALVAEPPCELDRVAALDRHRLPAPLREPHDTPFEHVDGRE